MNRLPAEWEEQDGVLLTWPQSAHHWGAMTPEVETVFINLAKAISTHEWLVVVCKDQAHQSALEKQFNAAGVNLAQTKFVHAIANDVWARDHGPIITQQQNTLFCHDFTFNGWGNKYPAEHDNEITAQLLDSPAFSSLPTKRHTFTLEGGGIETDGNGTLLVTTGCILTDTRNPNLTRSAADQFFAENFGTPNVIWLTDGHLEGDDTDGHIDTLARFVDAKTIVSVFCSDDNDTHYPALAAMDYQLHHARNMQNEPYHIIHLPWPEAIFNADNKRLPATYANFLFVNGAIIVPTYRQATDQVALDLLSAARPDLEIIPVDALPLIHQYGSIHCVTMQLPKGSLQL